MGCGLHISKAKVHRCIRETSYLHFNTIERKGESSVFKCIGSFAKHILHVNTCQPAKCFSVLAQPLRDGLRCITSANSSKTTYLIIGNTHCQYRISSAEHRHIQWQISVLQAFQYTILLSHFNNTCT